MSPKLPSLAAGPRWAAGDQLFVAFAAPWVGVLDNAFLERKGLRADIQGMPLLAGRTKGRVAAEQTPAHPAFEDHSERPVSALPVIENQLILQPCA